MLKEAFIATLYGGVPVFLFTCGLLYWAKQKGYRVRYRNDKKSEFEEHKPETKRLSAEGIVLNKWLTFGGGYYGMMALLTYLHVEVSDIIGAFANFESIQHFIDQISIGFFIGLIVEAFKNIIVAFLWFQYWGDILPINNGWVWLAATYGAFMIAEELIPQALLPKSEEPT
ncbi:hypothetical protein [Pleionea litopenaei]|uniref:Uncharacterized protein n=1 Tax=Pleionea litopenaei TaxID=3070815 RepID=A0AA51X7J7_9GAMM|nr:hypothetical protein [Pleionea sp. HL-JVS1]WMS88283.1 hypothetical protein Q9312_05035 [Pleionea sp. HL-JVS1]